MSKVLLIKFKTIKQDKTIHIKFIQLEVGGKNADDVEVIKVRESSIIYNRRLPICSMEQMHEHTKDFQTTDSYEIIDYFTRMYRRYEDVVIQVYNGHKKPTILKSKKRSVAVLGKFLPLIDRFMGTGSIAISRRRSFI